MGYGLLRALPSGSFEVLLLTALVPLATFPKELFVHSKCKPMKKDTISVVFCFRMLMCQSLLEFTPEVSLNLTMSVLFATSLNFYIVSLLMS